MANDEIEAERAALKATRAQFGKKVGWNCDEWMCDRTADDSVLWRVNPKGRPGIFMCTEHRDMIQEGSR